MDNNLINIMSLAVAINNKDSQAVTDAINSLSDKQLSISEKESLRLYEDTLINLSIENEEMLSFIISKEFLNQSIFDSRYISAIAEISSASVPKEKVKEYLSSPLSFDDPAKQYRYCFTVSNSAIRIGDSELLELAIKKMHDFITNQPDFVIPDYAPGA